MHRRAFTLIELLVVIGIIAILMAITLPAIQKVRAAADSLWCKNNLHQMGIASHNHENSYQSFPSLGDYRLLGGNVRYSAFAHLLPFIEEDNIHKLIDFGLTYDDQPLVTQQRIRTFLCPADPNKMGYQETPTRLLFPTSYGFNYGTWFVFDPNTKQSGDGAVVVNGVIRPRDIRDGLSTTMHIAEVKAWTPYYRDSGNPNALNTPPPASVDELLTYCSGGLLKANPDLGHTEWVDARVLHTGCTTVFTPNSKVMYEGYDIDFVSSREGRSNTLPTYCAMTSRSHHPNHVNVLMLDGSVHAARNNIDLAIWRALGTRAGGEVVGDF